MSINQYDKLEYASYKPFSSEDIWRPGIILKAEHDKIESDFAAEEKQGAISLLGLNSEIDKDVIAKKIAYMQQLRAASDELATKGVIDSGRRKNLNNLRSIYNNEIVPLQNALNVRNEAIKAYDNRLSLDSTFEATINPRNVSVKSYLDNPSAFSFDGVSGSKLAEDVSRSAQHISKYISQNAPELAATNMYGKWLAKIKSGASIDEVNKAMIQEHGASGSKMVSTLNKIVDDAMASHGVYDKFKGNDEAINRLFKTASTGLYSALGDKKFSFEDDQLAIAKEREKESNKKNSSPTIFGSRELSPIFNEGYINKALSNLSSIYTGDKGNAIFNKDGSLVKYDNNRKNISGPVGDAANMIHDMALKTYNQYSSIVKAAREKNGIDGANVMTDFEILNKIKTDASLRKKLMESNQRELVPIADVGTAQAAINKAFVSGASTTDFVEYNKNYSIQSDTPVGLDKIAKDAGFQNKDALINYITDSGIVPKYDKNSGLFTIEIPTGVASYSKSKGISFNDDDEKSTKIIGFATGAAHKHTSQTLRTYNRLSEEGKDGNLPQQVVSINGKDVIVTPKYSHKNKTILLYDETGKRPIVGSSGSIAMMSEKDLIDESMNTIESEELRPLYMVSSQKQTNYKPEKE